MMKKDILSARIREAMAQGKAWLEPNPHAKDCPCYSQQPCLENDGFVVDTDFPCNCGYYLGAGVLSQVVAQGDDTHVRPQHPAVFFDHQPVRITAPDGTLRGTGTILWIDGNGVATLAEPVPGVCVGDLITLP